MSNLRSATFGWSFPLFSIGGIAVRMHWFFLLWMGFELWPFERGWSVHLAELGILFGSVLLHEFGHSTACRSVGGTADRILLWPLGGLAECNPPLNPWASLWTTLCGPAVNLVIMGGCAAHIAWAQRAAGLELPISLVPWDMVNWQAERASELVTWVMMTYYFNYMLFVFNMVFICYPMDGGRVLQEVLWLFIGYARSMWVAVHIGLALAVAMIVMGATKTFHMGQINMIMGIFFLSRGWSLRQNLSALRADYGSLSNIPDPRETAQVGGWLGRHFVKPQDDLDVAARLYAKPRAAAPAAPSHEEVDRILRKISEHGMASLTEEDKTVLRGGNTE